MKNEKISKDANLIHGSTSTFDIAKKQASAIVIFKKVLNDNGEKNSKIIRIALQSGFGAALLTLGFSIEDVHKIDNMTDEILEDIKKVDEDEDECNCPNCKKQV